MAQVKRSECWLAALVVEAVAWLTALEEALAAAMLRPLDGQAWSLMEAVAEIFLMAAVATALGFAVTSPTKLMRLVKGDQMMSALGEVTSLEAVAEGFLVAVTGRSKVSLRLLLQSSSGLAAPHLPPPRSTPLLPRLPRESPSDLA